MPPRAVIFDLDGTLVDSLRDIGEAMNHALAAHGLPTHPLKEYRRFVGDGVKVLVSRVVPAERAELQTPVREAYLAFYAEHLLDHTQPFPGLLEVLARLEGEGVKRAVLSNKPDASTRHLVSTLFPRVRFDAVYGERAGVPRKPDPTSALGVAAELGVAPGDCAFIGDTSVDMDTSRAAGMFGVGVAWGFRDQAELEAHGARAFVQTAEQLLQVLWEFSPSVTRP
jgi:phosphoglycolate phosphatase